MAFSQDDQAVACCKSHLPSPHAALEALPGTSSSGIYLHEVAGTGSLERQMGHMMTDLDPLHLAENRPVE